MEIEEVLALVQAQKDKLRSIRLKHPNDVVTQSLVAEAQENLSEQIIALHKLYHYADGLRPLSDRERDEGHRSEPYSNGSAPSSASEIAPT